MMTGGAVVAGLSSASVCSPVKSWIMRGDTYPGAAGTVDGTVDEVLTHTLSSGTRSAGTTGAAASAGKGMGGGEGTRCCGDAGKRDGEGPRSGHKNGDGGSVGLKHCGSKFAAGTAGMGGSGWMSAFAETVCSREAGCECSVWMGGGEVCVVLGKTLTRIPSMNSRKVLISLRASSRRASLAAWVCFTSTNSSFSSSIWLEHCVHPLVYDGVVGGLVPDSSSEC